MKKTLLSTILVVAMIGLTACGSKTEEAPTVEEGATTEVSDFATKIVAAVDAKDIEALAELVTYPTYVGLGDGIEAASKEDFIAIGADALFTEELIAAVDAADLSAVEETEAGFILGGQKPDIIFGYAEDGTLGITGINY